ncbi:aminoacylase-1-like protein [Syncephalis pseudoplumigaleata]|uniref:N-acyl-aliphatic-L-amino acid amidohydrolase n=1 Tax=Syncephalis pseudoplumigaleata TaxID=1712513 RepID=A0A4P9Z5B6_9FUNG|nr:aminoacylase-1-like protein [Syncephalis pseudoplumigaleata]|eukprot:RKP27803.1 aminoacylase-1-like protein [Syncephalis pseudoplumigaleata]
MGRISANVALVDGASASKNDQLAVENFRDYLRIRTMHPTPDYQGAMAFLKRMAGELDVDFKIVEPVANKPVAILTWHGTDTKLPTLMLNSHTDVVPVFEERWTHDPFGADRVRQENGDYKIYARGAQDMKVVGMSYIEAVRRLKQQTWQPRRTIHMTFIPDEETGGAEGMAVFCQTPEFKALNVGLELDEGQASTDNDFIVYYDERVKAPFKIYAYGDTGHGSQFINNTAAKKLMGAINELMAFRDQQEELLRTGRRDGKPLTLGDVTTINLTILQGGVTSNIVPSNFTAGSSTASLLTRTMLPYARSVTMEFSMPPLPAPFATTTGSKAMESGIDWQRAFDKASKALNVHLRREIFPAATDARFLRKQGLTAFGISPINNTPILLHSDDEFVYESVYLRGITFYETLIRHLAE